MSKNKKEKLILKSGDMSQSKVKSFVEREDIENKFDHKNFGSKGSPS